MRHQAIRNCYSSVVFIDDAGATDAQGHPVMLDEAKISAEVTRLDTAYAATQYRRDRIYPPLGDQLDDLFRQGAFSLEMAAKLQAVKDAHPKGIV